jgi:pimeloyl-ACP methyl ester carboxylesterase
MANHNHSLIPGSQISVYKETGHAPFYENPEKFNLELAKFVTNSVGA